MCRKLLDKGNMKQRLPARDAERVMRNIPRKTRDDFCHLLHRKRIFVWNELMRTRPLLDHAVRMTSDLVLRIAIGTVKIAALKPHKDLPAAYVFPLPLYGGKDFDDVLAHISASYR